MSGMKNETQQLTGSSSLNPQLSKVNFACPSEHVLADFNPFGDKLPLTFPPGFLESCFEMVLESTRTHIRNYFTQFKYDILLCNGIVPL